MDRHITDQVTKRTQVPWIGNLSTWTDTITYRVICNTVYCVWQSDRKKGEIFEELEEGGTFWNDVDVSMLLSQHLNWKLLAFLAELSHFYLEYNPYKQIRNKIIKGFKILK